MGSEYEENRGFEDDVRKAAEAIWKLSTGECQPEFYSTDLVIRELDGLARLRDVTHLLMVTVSKNLQKIKEDARKLIAAEKIESKSGIPIRKWIITKYQLEAEHLRYCREKGITVLTLTDFRSRFFDGRSYISKRKNAPFGSARNPGNDSISIPENEYIELPMRIVSNNRGDLEKQKAISLSEIIDRLINGETIVIVASFGAGKSLTIREIFIKISDRYRKKGDCKIPVCVNLREHWGSKYSDEILERHAREIGFTPREDLVVAWRAGLVNILLDGFDEVAAPAVANPSNRNFMREARTHALEAVRELIEKMPLGSGIIITGRDHYFDNQKELSNALGFGSKEYIVVEIGEFSESQAVEYLKKKGVDLPLPDWLPRKPLILGYLASRDLLKDVVTIDASKGFGFAWNSFLDKICEREAAHGRSAMDPQLIRKLLERLAWDVRSTSSGTGPITERDLADSYLAETGQNASGAVLMQLQRLPGLTQRDQDPGARSFIDFDMLAALQGGVLARFILEGKIASSRSGWLAPLNRRAIAMTSYLLQEANSHPSTVISIGLRTLCGEPRWNIDPQIAADCLQVAIDMAQDEGTIDCQGMQITGLMIRKIPFEDLQIHNLTLKDCVIDEVIIGGTVLESSILIKNCAIVRIGGIADSNGLPTRIFQNCTVEEYDVMATNASIVRSALKPSMKALLTILRKIYFQSGAGRKLSALKRGLPPGPILNSVDSVVSILESEGVIAIQNDIAHPIRRQTARIKSIIAAASLSTDKIVSRALSL